ncbi:proline-rich receptor-like protein kinase PERK9 [Senna tora]|uniref:Proline-rich receptor-like protein kinase PERK9 n=1 Tax=Senna tora TaxID=362788 RepID=A0A834W1S6_9FABA|nr:proline-rich receptor-like protein kinase PERK9 [Senna tora]
MAAKSNKYTSINFNHIYEKTTTTSSSTHPAKNPSPSSSSSSYSAASYSAISSPNKPHGRMLVLSRPTPKPVTPPAPPSPQPQQPKQTQQVPDQPHSEPGSDSNAISLRPLGRTGTGSSLSSSPVLNCEKDKELPPPLISPKPDKFVPPHLRPGFVRREEKSAPDVVRSRQQGHVGSAGRYMEDGRPKSGGYERMRRGGASDVGVLSRPTSSGSRPSSSGWYARLLDSNLCCPCNFLL